MIVGPSNLTRGLQWNTFSNVLGNSIDTMMYRQLSLTNIWFHGTSLRRASPSQGNLTYVKWVHSMGRLLAPHAAGRGSKVPVLIHRTMVDGLRIGWTTRLEIEEQVDLKFNNKEAQKVIL